jgi:hypothetical protein
MRFPGRVSRWNLQLDLRGLWSLWGRQLLEQIQLRRVGTVVMNCLLGLVLVPLWNCHCFVMGLMPVFVSIQAV